MSQRAAKPAHVDAVRRVESGHVLVLVSWDLEELVGEMADARAEGWELIGGVSMVWAIEGTASMPWYTATLIRGHSGSPLGMDMQGGE